jgi:hypothetical protein
MIPFLLVYYILGKRDKDQDLSNYSLLAIVALLAGWLAWILLVDYNTGEFGAYWSTRISMSQYAAGNPINFFIELVNSFVYSHDIRDEIRYSTALIIPLTTFWIIGKIPMMKDTHRYALAFGNLAMLIIALLFGNPNKIIVYSTTLPGYFSVYLIFFQFIFNKDWLSNFFHRVVVLPLFILFCLIAVFIYVVGTPLGWYY